MGKSAFIALLIIYCLPFLDPTIIQRMLMARSGREIRSVMFRAGIIVILLQTSIALIGLMAFVLSPGIAPDAVFLHMTQHYMPLAYRGVVISGLLAVVMSTADSYLNIAGVSLAHDVLKPLAYRSIDGVQELRLARRVTFVVGFLGLLAALFSQRILALCMVGCSCWAPVVLVPLYAGLFGYRASARTFVLGILGGQVAFWACLYTLGNDLGGLMAIVPAILANGLVFFIARRFDPPSVTAQPPKPYQAVRNGARSSTQD
jgi:SSS family solute:Na+ symporter